MNLSDDELPPAYAFQVLDTIKAMRDGDDDLFETAMKIIVSETVRRTHDQKVAAMIIGISPRVLNYHMMRWGWRRKDVRRREREEEAAI